VNAAWRAHKCHGYDHEIIIIESLDPDSETRRLSPVALLADKYIDLNNGSFDFLNQKNALLQKFLHVRVDYTAGPQDHGWCAGYTCQQRISTFWTIVALNRAYELHFSGFLNVVTEIFLNWCGK